MDFGDRIREARRAKGYTQEQLASIIGVAKSTLTGYEKGNREPDVLKIRAISQALDVSGSFLLGLDEKELSSSLTPAGQRIGHLYDRADDRAKEIVEFTLKSFDDGKSIRITPPAKQVSEIATELNPDADYTELKLYTQSVAAGLGNYQDDDDYELVRFKDAPRRAVIAVKVSGDSMEPDYHNGDIVYVETDSMLSDGEIGIFNYDGEGYIKELRRDPARLVSLNPKYEDKLINTDGDIPFKTIGRVVGVAE